jgi:heme-degrading monooxygenase HmoA
MIAVLSIIEIHPDRRQVWKQLRQQVEASQRAADGFRAIRVFHDTDHPERYLVLSEWEDRARYDAYIRHIGIPWLQDAWEFERRPATVMFLEEETGS